MFGKKRPQDSAKQTFLKGLGCNLLKIKRKEKEKKRPKDKVASLSHDFKKLFIEKLKGTGNRNWTNDTTGRTDHQ